MAQDTFIQTIDEMKRETCLKALHRGRTSESAAYLMGVCIRTVERMKKRYDIYYDQDWGTYKINPKKRKHVQQIK